MIGALKWLAGLALVATLGIAAGVYFAFFGVGEQISYRLTSRPSSCPRP
jgi:hypothetical protein